MEPSKHNAINSLLVLHLNVTVLEALCFLVGRLSDNNIHNFPVLLEIIDDLGAGDGGVQLIYEYLVIIVVAADVEVVVTDFYRFKLIKFGGSLGINFKVCPIFVRPTNDLNLWAFVPEVGLKTIQDQFRQLFLINGLLLELVQVNHVLLLAIHE